MLSQFGVFEIEDGYYIPANSDGFVKSITVYKNIEDDRSGKYKTLQIKYTMRRENGNWESALISGDDFEVNYPAESEEARKLDNQVLSGEIVKVEVEEVE